MKRLKFRPLIFGMLVSFLVGIVVYFLTDPALISRIPIFQPKDTPIPSPVVSALSTDKTRQPPTAVNIPKIRKNLPVQAATVRGNDWDMFDSSVAWLSTSAIPGEGRNVILYAHNWKKLWGDLYLLKPGDTIEVQQNMEWKTYVVQETHAVKPNDVESILSDQDQLTLFTCEGSFDQKRRVVYAQPLH